MYLVFYGMFKVVHYIDRATKMKFLHPFWLIHIFKPLKNEKLYKHYLQKKKATCKTPDEMHTSYIAMEL